MDIELKSWLTKGTCMQTVPWSIELDEPMKLKDELIIKELRYHVWSWI